MIPCDQMLRMMFAITSAHTVERNGSRNERRSISCRSRSCARCALEGERSRPLSLARRRSRLVLGSRPPEATNARSMPVITRPLISGQAT